MHRLISSPRAAYFFWVAVTFGGIASALQAQTASPTPAPLPPMVAGTPGAYPMPSATPTPYALPTPVAMPTPLPDGSLPLPLPPLPLPPLAASTPGAYPSASAMPTPFALPSPNAKPTPLPDGSMPLPLQSLPSPTPINAATLSEQLSLPLTTPTQFSETLAPGQETKTLKETENLAMQQKMVMESFEKAIMTLVAQEGTRAWRTLRLTTL